MAEILAVVASGMGVASLAMQVASSVKKLKDFCDRVKDTPSEVRDTLEDIEILSIVIDEIEAMARSGGCLPQGLHNALLRSAKRCLEASDGLRSIASEIEAAIQKRKLRGAVKGALKKSRLDEIRQRLESAKMTCVLAGQSHQRQQNENINTSILLLQQSVHIYPELSPSPSENLSLTPNEFSIAEPTQGNLPTTAPFYNSSYENKYSWGFFQVRHITRLSKHGMQGNKAKQSPRKESQTLISAQLPHWLLRHRFDLYTSWTHSGWDFSLDIYNVRPHDAPIFQHVEDGNISAIQQLFQESMASVFDVDESGTPLLHYAIHGKRVLHLETLKFLLECGASIRMRDNLGYSPLLELLFYGQDICFRDSQPDEFQEALQYLLDYGSCPYTESAYSELTSLELYSGSVEGQRILLNSLPLQTLSSEDFDVLNTLQTMVDLWVSNPLQLIRNLLPEGKLNTMTEEEIDGDFLNLSMKYLCDPTDEWPAFMEELLDAGADVHGYRKWHDIWATPFWHLLWANGCIISYSTIYDRRNNQGIEDTLASWLGILEKCGYDVSDYLAEEERLRKFDDQPLPDTLARVEIKASTGEVVIEHEWAYLWREFDDENIWDFQLDIPKRCPDNYRFETFWRCVEEELEAVELVPGNLKMPGSWEE